jgi:uncharacterized repeat protein (TIGR03803 family)
MAQTILRCSAKRILFPFVATLILTSAAFSATKELVLHSFNGQHAIDPLAGLLRDPAGNLFGTTGIGGSDCPPTCGTVFELSPSSKGWKYRVIHNFTGGNDGLDPRTTLIRDSKGNLYGTTLSGGTTSCFGQPFQGCGTLFKLSPNSSGGWDETVIYRFKGTSDGAFPEAALVFDAAGNLYGTATWGGITTCNPPYGCGTVFKLTPSGNGWSFSVIHTFDNTDGAYPNALAFGANGTLYGSAGGGGDFCLDGCGVVFRLVPNENSWAESVLYSFTSGSDGISPFSLVRDANGTLYGVTSEGGSLVCSFGCGNVFALAHDATGWNFSVVRSFDGPDGAYPTGIILDPEGDIYGTTLDGGGHQDCFDGCGLGVLFKLTPDSGGSWTESILHIFTGGRDGGQPFGAVTFDDSGNLYGTTYLGGGSGGFGVVYEVIP